MFDDVPEHLPPPPDDLAGPVPLPELHDLAMHHRIDAEVVDVEARALGVQAGLLELLDGWQAVLQRERHARQQVVVAEVHGLESLRNRRAEYRDALAELAVSTGLLDAALDPHAVGLEQARRARRAGRPVPEPAGVRSAYEAADVVSQHELGQALDRVGQRFEFLAAARRQQQSFLGTARFKAASSATRTAFVDAVVAACVVADLTDHLLDVHVALEAADAVCRPDSPTERNPDDA